jgi:DNA-binding response OmpR family regulator
MARENKPRFVAVLNSNDDLVRLIRETLHDEGYLTMHHHIADLRDGKTDITRLFEDRDPTVVIYDIAPPFTINWQFLQVLSAHSSMKRRSVIVTTTNAAALKEMCGVDALQIVGGNKDLAELVDAVNGEFRRRAGGPPPQPGSRLRKVGRNA